jgi:hypothetical protein
MYTETLIPTESIDNEAKFVEKPLNAASLHRGPIMLPPFNLDDFDPRERDRSLTFHWLPRAEWACLPGLPWSKDKRWNAALNSILAEAILAHEEGRWVSYSRRRAFYAGLTRYHGTAYTFATVLQAVDELMRLDFLEEERASPGQRGRQSRFQATPELIEAFEGASFEYRLQGLIRLKDADGHLIRYRDTDERRRMLRDMERINEFLATLDLWLDAPDITRTAHHLIVDGAYYRQTTPALYRVFNRGSFSFGGRFYGWWQSLPRGRRRQLVLNGEAVVEPDFEQMHVSMLYAMSGQRLEGDAYETGEFPREHGKLAFNVALNARTRQGAIAALTKKPNWPYAHKETSSLIEVLKRRNAPIAEYLHADIGICLMRTDSNITRDVMKACARENIPALPVHDSVLTSPHHEGRIAEIMEASAARHFNGSSPCRVRVSGELVPHMPSPTVAPAPLPASPSLPLFSPTSLSSEEVVGTISFEGCSPDGQMSFLPMLEDHAPELVAVAEASVYEGGIIPDPMIRLMRDTRRRRGERQKDMARKLGISQPQLANAERQRSGLGRGPAARLKRWIAGDVTAT